MRQHQLHGSLARQPSCRSPPAKPARPAEHGTTLDPLHHICAAASTQTTAPPMSISACVLILSVLEYISTRGVYLPPKFDLSWPLIAIDPLSLGHTKMETRPTRILIKSVTLALYPPKLSSLDCSYFLMDPTCVLFHISVFSHLENQRKLTFGFVGRFRLRGIAAHVRYELHQRRSECIRSVSLRAFLGSPLLCCSGLSSVTMPQPG